MMPQQPRHILGYRERQVIPWRCRLGFHKWRYSGGEIKLIGDHHVGLSGVRDCQRCGKHEKLFRVFGHD